MIDQWWNFAYSVNDSLKMQGLEEQGCNYVPLPITISEDVKNQWHTTGLSGDNINEASGIGHHHQLRRHRRRAELHQRPARPGSSRPAQLGR